MPAPPARNEISDDYPNPSNAVARVGLGKLWDYMTGLLGASGDAPDALAALGAAPIDSPTFTTEARGPTEASTENSTKLATTAWAKVGFAISLGSVGYIKFPDWMGGLIIQWGSIVVTSDGTAQAAFSYPLTFPNAVYTTIAFNGDNGAAVTNKTAIYGANAGTTSVARFVYIDTTTGAGITSAAVRINWVAFGS